MTRATLLACILATAGCSPVINITGPVSVFTLADGNTVEQPSEVLAENLSSTENRREAAP